MNCPICTRLGNHIGFVAVYCPECEKLPVDPEPKKETAQERLAKILNKNKTKKCSCDVQNMCPDKCGCSGCDKHIPF